MAHTLGHAAYNSNVQAGENCPVLQGPYLGQTPPGTTPEAFAPGIISTEGWEMSGVFTPDLSEFYYIKEVVIEQQYRQQFIMYKNGDNGWTPTIISPRVGEPFISPDGQVMHLGRYYKRRQNEQWSEIKALDERFLSIPIMRMTSSKMVLMCLTKQLMRVCCVIPR